MKIFKKKNVLIDKTELPYNIVSILIYLLTKHTYFSRGFLLFLRNVHFTPQGRCSVQCYVHNSTNKPRNAHSMLPLQRNTYIAHTHSLTNHKMVLCNFLITRMNEFCPFVRPHSASAVKFYVYRLYKVLYDRCLGQIDANIVFLMRS